MNLQFQFGNARFRNAGLDSDLDVNQHVILGRDRSGRRDEKRARMGEAHHASGDALG
jgi:hypothetical protein